MQGLSTQGYSYNDLKTLVRGSDFLSLRNNPSEDWPYLVNFNGEKSPQLARYNVVKRLLALSNNLPDSNPPAVTESSVQSLVSDPQEILLMLCSQYSIIEFKELVIPIVSIISQHCTRPDAAFSVSCDMLDNARMYLTPRAKDYRSRIAAFRNLLSARMPKTANALEMIGGLDDSHLNHIFVFFFSEILPTQHVKKIIEMFLLEGCKILFRFGIALIRYFKKEIKNNTFATGEKFWKSLLNRRSRGAGDNLGTGLGNGSYRSNDESQLINFQTLMQFAFEQRTSSSIFTVVVGRNMKLSRGILAETEAVELKRLGDSASEPLSLNLSTDLDCVTFFLGRSTQSPGEKGNGAQLLYRTQRSEALISASKILSSSPEASLMLHSFLPEDGLATKFSLKFSTESDGWNLDTLYRRAHSTNPSSSSIVLIKVQDTPAIIGIFLAGASLGPPLNRQKGGGLSFLFRLDGLRAACYRWTGLNDSSASALSAESSQICVCTSDSLIFGASALTFSNALRIFDDLKQGETGMADTFANTNILPELCQDTVYNDMDNAEDKATRNSSLFDIECLEVLSA